MINENLSTPIKHDCDVLVCGGGIAGISAALAAARNGSKVLLIENQFMLGGLATAGLITIYLPICDGNGNQVSFGIAEELLKLSIADGYEGKYPDAWLDNTDPNEKRKRQRFEVQYNPHIFAIRAEQLLIKNGVDILYGTKVSDVTVNNNKIEYIIIENKSGRSAIKLKNIVDATGDADVCYLSGEKTYEYKENNPTAAWYYDTRDGRYTLNMLGFLDVPNLDNREDEIKETVKDFDFEKFDAENLSDYTIYAHKLLLENFLKKGKNSTEHALATIATIPQIRMTRRICGVSTINGTEEGLLDSVGLFSNWRKKGPVYELPFSALYGNIIKNLITAGRCISASNDMWDITRVIPVCAVSGEAAGVAASMTDDFKSIDIIELQNRLRKNGVIIHNKDLKF